MFFGTKLAHTHIYVHQTIIIIVKISNMCLEQQQQLQRKRRLSRKPNFRCSGVWWACVRRAGICMCVGLVPFFCQKFGKIELNKNHPSIRTFTWRRRDAWHKEKERERVQRQRLIDFMFLRYVCVCLSARYYYYALRMARFFLFVAVTTVCLTAFKLRMREKSCCYRRIFFVSSRQCLPLFLFKRRKKKDFGVAFQFSKRRKKNFGVADETNWPTRQTWKLTFRGQFPITSAKTAIRSSSSVESPSRTSESSATCRPLDIHFDFYMKETTRERKKNRFLFWNTLSQFVAVRGYRFSIALFIYVDSRKGKSRSAYIFFCRLLLLCDWVSVAVVISIDWVVAASWLNQRQQMQFFISHACKGNRKWNSSTAQTQRCQPKHREKRQQQISRRKKTSREKMIVNSLEWRNKFASTSKFRRSRKKRGSSFRCDLHLAAVCVCLGLYAKSVDCVRHFFILLSVVLLFQRFVCFWNAKQAKRRILFIVERSVCALQYTHNWIR